MRKSRSRFALFPQPIRNGINLKLDDGWPYERIRDWLFAQTADRDIPALDLKTGDPYSLIWTRTTTDEKIIIRNFGIALSNWYHTHYPAWRDEQAWRDESLHLVESVDKLTAAASTQNRSASHLGGNLLIRSLLLDALRTTRKGSNNPDQLARLAHAWARVSQVDEHTIDIGISALAEELNANPKAVELFRQLRDVVNAAKQSSGSV
jgi:hypothetical protein